MVGGSAPPVVGADSVVITTRSDYEVGASGNLLWLRTMDNFGRDELEYHHGYGFCDKLGVRAYQLKDQLGSVRAVVRGGAVVEWQDYYCYGAVRDGASRHDGRWKYLAAEADHETATLHLQAREYDFFTGFMQIDPLWAKYPARSPYNYVGNNPLTRKDPTGRFDWVINEDGQIYWDANANSQETTKSGETYLGKQIVFVFNSYIDGELWDGPMGKLPAGNKLTSTIVLTGIENDEGELVYIETATNAEVGPTPVGTARNYYPGLSEDQNQVLTSHSVGADGTLSSYNLNFEQHASVSFIEQVGLEMMGYSIVNVAQKLILNFSENKLSVAAFTDIFPSATLQANHVQLFRYNQPSFQSTHGWGYSMMYGYTSFRPAPSFHLRYKK